MRRSRCSFGSPGGTGRFVTSAFVVGVREGLRSDYQKNELRPPRDCRQCLAWEHSDRHRCRFHYIGWPRSHCCPRPATFYSSFAISLAAFTPTLAKQCLNRCAQAEMRGSVVNHSGYRQRKMNGIVTWRFDQRLSEAFSNLTPTPEEIDRALKAMELFHVIMQAPGSIATPRRRSGTPLVNIYRPQTRWPH